MSRSMHIEPAPEQVARIADLLNRDDDQLVPYLLVALGSLENVARLYEPRRPRFWLNSSDSNLLTTITDAQAATLLGDIRVIRFAVQETLPRRYALAHRRVLDALVSNLWVLRHVWKMREEGVATDDVKRYLIPLFRSIFRSCETRFLCNTWQVFAPYDGPWCGHHSPLPAMDTDLHQESHAAVFIRFLPRLLQAPERLALYPTRKPRGRVANDLNLAFSVGHKLRTPLVRLLYLDACRIETYSQLSAQSAALPAESISRRFLLAVFQSQFKAEILTDSSFFLSPIAYQHLATAYTPWNDCEDGPWRQSPGEGGVGRLERMCRERRLWDRNFQYRRPDQTSAAAEPQGRGIPGTKRDDLFWRTWCRSLPLDKCVVCVDHADILAEPERQYLKAVTRCVQDQPGVPFHIVQFHYVSSGLSLEVQVPDDDAVLPYRRSPDVRRLLSVLSPLRHFNAALAGVVAGHFGFQLTKSLWRQLLDDREYAIRGIGHDWYQIVREDRTDDDFDSWALDTYPRALLDEIITHLQQQLETLDDHGLAAVLLVDVLAYQYCFPGSASWVASYLDAYAQALANGDISLLQQLVALGYTLQVEELLAKHDILWEQQLVTGAIAWSQILAPAASPPEPETVRSAVYVIDTLSNFSLSSALLASLQRAKGHLLMRCGQLHDALTAFRKAVEVTDYHVEAFRHLLLQCATLPGHNDSDAMWVPLASRVCERQPPACLLLMGTLLDRGGLRELHSLGERWLVTKPFAMYGHLARALVALATGNDGEALSIANHLRPMASPAHRPLIQALMAAVLARQDRFADELEMHETISPADRDAFVRGRIVSLYRMRQDPRALREARDSLLPDKFDSHYHLVRTLAQDNDYQGLRRAYQDMLSHLRRGGWHRQMSAAIDETEQWLYSSPDYALLYRMAVCAGGGTQPEARLNWLPTVTDKVAVLAEVVVSESGGLHRGRVPAFRELLDNYLPPRFDVEYLRIPDDMEHRFNICDRNTGGRCICCLNRAERPGLWVVQKPIDSTRRIFSAAGVLQAVEHCDRMHIPEREDLFSSNPYFSQTRLNRP